METTIERTVQCPSGTCLTVADYERFLHEAFALMQRHPQYMAPSEDINCIELAHLLPPVRETVIAIYLGINDAACNKGLVSPFLIRHGHNNVFTFAQTSMREARMCLPARWTPRRSYPGFEPPNETWNPDWTYVMISDWFYRGKHVCRLPLLQGSVNG